MWFSHQNGCFRKVNLKNDIKLKKKKKKKKPYQVPIQSSKNNDYFIGIRSSYKSFVTFGSEKFGALNSLKSIIKSKTSLIYRSNLRQTTFITSLPNM